MNVVNVVCHAESGHWSETFNGGGRRSQRGRGGGMVGLNASLNKEGHHYSQTLIHQFASFSSLPLISISCALLICYIKITLKPNKKKVGMIIVFTRRVRIVSRN